MKEGTVKYFEEDEAFEYCFAGLQVEEAVCNGNWEKSPCLFHVGKCPIEYKGH